MNTPYQKVRITGADYAAWKITDGEWKRDRRVQRLRRERRQKYMTVGLALIAIACMILICIVSYSSIKAHASAGFKYYTGITVESGETLWNIADRYIDYEYYADRDTYIAEIENINHLDADGSLLAGQFLVIPYYSMEYVP